MRTGSAHYPGAAVLGVSAAWRTGVGMVRYVAPTDDSPAPYGLPAPSAAVLAARPETVFGEPGSRPCDAWVVGSGTDPGRRSPDERTALLELLRGEAPVVIDAGALDLVTVDGEAGSDAARRLTAPTILTPHGGEFERLWEAAGMGGLPEGWDPRGGDPEARAAAAGRLAERLRATVLLKGSITLCMTPNGEHLTAGPATPWLATAGTGDVLGGILGALVAAHSEAVRRNPELLGPLGATAALLHDAAARVAAHDLEATGCGRPIAALDVADAIPEAFAALA